jgi:dephospho-CoA kinase
MYKKLYTIGLTGGICSGKSTLKKFFLRYDNIKFLNFDDFTSIIYQRDNLLKKKLVDTFGEQILKNNEIDKKTLGSIVFKDKEKLVLLKSLVSPALRQFYFDQKNELEFKNTTYDLLVVEGPTIIESKVHVINL